MLKIKNGGLDQYGIGPFEQQQFGTAGVEGVNVALQNFVWVLWHKDCASYCFVILSTNHSNLFCVY